MTRQPTPDAEQEVFADGIAEDIIKALSRFHWFFVIARNSSFSDKGTSPDIRDVARDLGVYYVLEQRAQGGEPSSGHCAPAVAVAGSFAPVSGV